MPRFQICLADLYRTVFYGVSTKQPMFIKCPPSLAGHYWSYSSI